MYLVESIRLLKRFYWRIYQVITRSGSPGICNDLIEWIKVNGGHGKVVYNIQNKFKPHFSQHERFLAVIKRPTIHTSSGYIQLPTGEIILDTAWIPENILGNQNYFLKIKNNTIEKKGKWFSIILYWSENYFHWFCDVLPRLYQILDKLPKETKFIVPINLEDWKIKSLLAFGIESENSVEFDGKIPWLLEELYYCPPIAMTGDIDRKSILWVQSRLYKILSNEKQSSTGTKIFLSRKKALRRRIINENELVDMLTTLGFVVVHAEDYTLEEQIGIFNHANFVVGPHGAGLTNVLHCKPGTKILEIFDSSIIRRCYWSLSHALDLEYVCYMGKHIHHDLKGEGDIYIDMSDFRSKFNLWYEGEGAVISDESI